MTDKSPAAFQTETTPEGEQTLVPGVEPVTRRERIESLLNAPLGPRCQQRPLDIGLFDEDARRQFDLF